MNDPVLVVPFNVELLSQIRRRKLIVRTDSPTALGEISRIAGVHNRLVCIRLNFPGTLSDLPLSESWIGTPIDAYVSSLGDFARIVEKLPVLRNLSIKVFFSSQLPKSYRYARILSSLMIASGIVLEGEEIDWTSLNDLMHYAVYGRVKHAPIEPFHYIISHYSPTALTDFKTISLEDSAQFLHCDEEGQIALSQADLAKKDSITTLENLDAFLAEGSSRTRAVQWNDSYFLQRTGCASCPAWRICLGAFERSHDNGQGCKQFFSDLMDAAEYVQEKEKRSPNPWQP